MTTETSTFEILVMVPGQTAKEVTVEQGTTIRQLAERIGVPNPEGASAIDPLGERLDGDREIEPGMEAISFILNLAGA